MVQMLKEKMLDKINSNPCEVKKALENMNRYGKTYMVVENGFYITGYRKTLKGAKSFAEKSLTQWYDDYTQDMTHNTNEVLEVTREELTDYSSDVTAWYNFFLNNPEAASYYTEAKYFFNVYVNDFYPTEEVRSYIEEQYDRMAQGKAPVAPAAEKAPEETLEKDQTEEEPQEAPDEEAEAIQVVENKEQNGVEIYFQTKPSAEVIQELKDNKFRWHKAKKCWYTKATPEAREFVAILGGAQLEEAPEPEKAPATSLEPGQYTMKRTDNMHQAGGAILNQVTIKEAKVEQYAQYKKSLKLTYISKGERKLRHVRFVSDSIEFYKGWDSSQSVDGLQLVAIYANGYDGFIKF